LLYDRGESQLEEDFVLERLASFKRVAVLERAEE
jgi:hypothetical protein